MAHTFIPCPWEAEEGESLRPRPDSSTELIPEQPGLCRETLPQKTKQKSKALKEKNEIGLWSSNHVFNCGLFDVKGRWHCVC